MNSTWHGESPTRSRNIRALVQGLKTMEDDQFDKYLKDFEYISLSLWYIYDHANLTTYLILGGVLLACPMD